MSDVDDVLAQVMPIGDDLPQVQEFGDAVAEDIARRERERQLLAPPSGALGLAMCDDCGALVVNTELHDRFHASLAREEEI